MDEKVDTRTEQKIRTGQTVRILIMLAAVAVLVVWGFANTDDVEVDWLVATTTGPLVLVIAASAIAGFLLGLLSAWRHRQ